MTTRTNKPFLYKIPFYGLNAFLVTSIPQFNKLLDKLGMSNYNLKEDCNYVGYCFFIKEVGVFVVGVFNNSNSTLVHELSHLMICLYEHIGSNINDETTEPFAYQLGYMFEIFSEQMRLANDK